MLADITQTVTDDAENERELLEGLRVVAKVTALCTELSVEADPERPRFFDMCSHTRMVGGPNPDGSYLLAMIRGDRTYRVTGTRGTHRLSRLPGARRHRADAATDGRLRQRHRPQARARGRSRWCSRRPSRAADILGGAQWVPIPADASSIVVREYIGDADAEDPATLDIEAADADPLQPITDAEAAEQFTAMAWTIDEADHAAPHHQARAADPAQHAAHRRGRRTRRRRHHPRQPVHDRHLPARARRVAGARVRARPTPATGTSRWRTSGTNASSRGAGTARSPTRASRPTPTDVVRIAIGAKDFGHGHWLDTGGRHRGFVVLRWLDNPDPPDVSRHRAQRSGDAVSAADRFDPDTLIDAGLRVWRAATTSATSTTRPGATGWPGCADGLVTEARLRRPRGRDRRAGHRARR